MKIIDVLNMISKGEEVPHFKCVDLEYYVGEDKYLKRQNGDDVKWLIYKDWLNEKVEIIEEDKKIEKVKWNEKSSYNQEVDTKKVQKILLSRSEQLKSSINEIIDKLKEEKE